MLLVSFSVAFLWVLQIAFFEPNYVMAATELLRGHLEVMAAEIEHMDHASSLVELSKTIKGKVLMLDGEGRIFSVYSMGSPVNLKVEREEGQFIYKNNRYKTVIGGKIVEGVINRGEPDMKIAMGFPVRHRGEPAALFLYNSLSELSAMQRMVRWQLFCLSVVLTAVASLAAFFLTGHFTRPVIALKEAVDRLADGELNAVARIKRRDELGKLSDSVEKLGIALKRVDVLRGEVISNVSHELRSPLSLIAGYGEMVRDLTWSDEAKRNDGLNLIISEAGRLAGMVDDILDYSQLRAGGFKLNLSEWNLYEIAAAEVEFGRHIGESWNLGFNLKSYSTGIVVKIDAVKMTQVLRNLMSNAINHTADARCIDISIVREENGLKVAVSNPGEEISEESKELIWERYQRVQHQGGRREGTGIGLSLVSAILSAHGFAYGVDSVEGQNTFWFVVPESSLGPADPIDKSKFTI